MNKIFMGQKEWNEYKTEMNNLLDKKALGGHFTKDDEERLEKVKNKVYEGIENSRKYLI